LVDPATDNPRPGREDQWGLFTEYRVRLARAERDFATAHRLQTRRVTWDRDLAVAALAINPDQLTDTHRIRVRTLAVSIEALGHILREQQHPDCVPQYLEAADLYRRIGARTEEGAVAYNLGRSYLEIPRLRDLDQAEHWFRRALDLTDEHDHLRRAGRVGALGGIARERFLDGRAAGEPEQVLLDHINAAVKAYHLALPLIPADNPTTHGITHNQLGNIYYETGQLETALSHYRQAIRYCEDAGDRYGAGRTRFNVALALALALDRADRTADALLYAHAALRDYQTIGPGAADEIETTQQLITRLEADTR
jgi:tetratricopeptide (TPR) repeat protein